jgi:hypothetical protein
MNRSNSELAGFPLFPLVSSNTALADLYIHGEPVPDNLDDAGTSHSLNLIENETPGDLPTYSLNLIENEPPGDPPPYSPVENPNNETKPNFFKRWRENIRAPWQNEADRQRSSLIDQTLLGFHEEYKVYKTNNEEFKWALTEYNAHDEQSGRLKTAFQKIINNPNDDYFKTLAQLKEDMVAEIRKIDYSMEKVQQAKPVVEIIQIKLTYLKDKMVEVYREHPSIKISGYCLTIRDGLLNVNSAWKKMDNYSRAYPEIRNDLDELSTDIDAQLSTPPPPYKQP